MQYDLKTFDNLKELDGLSASLIETHLKLYEGYVKNVNKLNDLLIKLGKDSPEYAELHRRYGWEWNGMRLHELYFANLSKNSAKLDENSPLYLKITEEFGSFDAFLEDFKALGSIRGIGWVVLYLDPETGHLTNIWVNEHDQGHLAGCKPLLVLDLFEHAYMGDFGTKKPDYIAKFIDLIDWEIVSDRFDG